MGSSQNSKCHISDNHEHSLLGGVTLHYTLGRDIYIGWVSGLLTSVAAVCLLCGSCNEDEVEDAPYETGTKVSYSTYTKDPADGPEQHYI